jgi:hypothetical protein
MGTYTKKYNAVKKDNSCVSFPFKSCVCFIASVLIAIILHVGIAFVAREEVKAFLGKVSPNVQIYIDEQQVNNTSQVINPLKNIRRFPSHGSHPTKKITIKIVNSDETLRLVLGRDSRYPQDYWVFYPKYSHTSTSEIGGIRTKLLDDY